MSNSTIGKRKRLQPAQQDLRQTIAEQFDLEIALKKRLLASANARLEWAHVLKSSITGNDCSAPALGYPPAAFRDAALATYEAIEEPCRFMISSPERPVRRQVNGRTTMRPDIRATEAPRTRKRATLGLGQGSTAGPLLFEDKSTATPVTLKLVCSDCSRSDFPTMQGFLNHCRLAHLRNYGTHDECIQACGVIVNNDEKEILAAAGVEIKTIHLLSLKRIFERAVGLGQSVGPESGDTMTDQLVDETQRISTHLSQTLGLHKDTPTLAPFLGKEVKKKVIHVYDESEAIDILELDDYTPSKPRPRWITQRKNMSDPVDKISINMAALAVERTGEIEGPQHVLNAMSDQGSRFHIMRRILVSDRSLYLPPNKRASIPDTIPHTIPHTHRWQISVSSPSYGQHISTFLSRLTVICVSQPPVFASPITVLESPFIACSTTSRPFLARLTLKWAGEQNNDFVVEHWVELDQFKATRPVLGEEQMLDVELDRNTNFQPASTGAVGVPWNGEGDHGIGHKSNSPTLDSNVENEIDRSSTSEPPHSRLLKSIVPRFPMTLQDVAGRQSPRVPYVVHPSPAKFLGLVMGRRKAIEWSRAFAIRSEYDSLIASSSSSDEYPDLTTADVYRWLESEGLFPRLRPKVQKKTPVQAESPRSTPTSVQEVKAEPLYCSVCGVDVRFHAPGVPLKFDQQSEDGRTGFHCPAELERSQAPLVHLYALVAPLRIPYWALRSDQTRRNITQSDPRDIMSLAHPHITRLTRQEAGSLKLSRFKALQAGDGCKISVYGSRDELEETISPYAFLGIVVEKVIRDLVGSALQVARENQGRTTTAFGRTRGDTLRSLLTPTHVLQGLMKGAEMGGPKEALFKCLARVGTVLETARTSGGTVTAASGPA